MTVTRQQPAQSGGSPTVSPGSAEKPPPSPALSADNLVVGASMLSVLLSILIAVKILSPILLTAAIFPFFIHVMKKGRHRRAAILTARWAITVFICVVITAGFVSDRAEKSFPLAKTSVDVIEDWIAGTSDTPPADFKLLVGGIFAFVAAAAVSGGALAFVLASLALASSACGSAFLFLQGDNILHILLIAVQPWLLCIFAAGIFLVVPSASLLLKRCMAEPVPAGNKPLRRYIYVGTALFLLSIGLRIFTAGTWRAFTERWTIS
ncbi:MAG: hypothetical protein ABIA59_06485 [Candidatus Latescibacterota bacterium]